MTPRPDGKRTGSRRAELSVKIVGATEGILPDWFAPDETNSALNLLDYVGHLGLQRYYDPETRPLGRQTAFLHARFSSTSRVFEHVQVTFDVAGVSRSLARDLAAQRELVIGQLRQPGFPISDARFVPPPGLPPHVVQLLETAFEAQLSQYLEFQAQLHERSLPRVSGDIRRQACVALLPNMIETKVVVSGNLLNWIKFIEARDSTDSPGEIRELAKEIARQLADRYPPIFGEEGRALWHKLP
nr:FAD-dependent thymidylate synthase [uncultured Rhodococcus sp.]